MIFSGGEVVDVPDVVFHSLQRGICHCSLRLLPIYCTITVLIGLDIIHNYLLGYSYTGPA